jgi:hypothetical protein
VVRIVGDMLNPSVVQQLGKERQREILEASRIEGASGSEGPGIRERLGWSLVGLGVHIAMHGHRDYALRPIARP